MTDIDQVLQFLRDRQLPLTHAGVIWSPGVRVPRAIRATVRANRAEVRGMISVGDTRVCASPGLHRREWYHAGQQRYTCAICARLEPWIDIERRERRRKAG